ncbi:MAG TPA: DNA-3-methyladenine glycosylase I [Thermoanaerobaculia bacterium]|jgi:DNA-3-methyladenine glycosylase I|nr:DNA-3-methyladenine glycosylase I [Thermoanaerobaculia bacterium]
MTTPDPSLPRCGWATSDPLYLAYHDEEWGVPVHDDRRLFEMLILEGAQAGLAWITILKRREGYRKAFHGFDPKKIARYGEKDITRLLADPGIIRNRAKVEATIKNARAYLDLVEEAGSLDAFLWGFVGGKPRVNHWQTLKEIPPETAESKALSKELKRRGFGFVGSTICYAFMQAVGMVDDHVATCFKRHPSSGPPARRSP